MMSQVFGGNCFLLRGKTERGYEEDRAAAQWAHRLSGATTCERTTLIRVLPKAVRSQAMADRRKRGGFLGSLCRVNRDDVLTYKRSDLSSLSCAECNKMITLPLRGLSREELLIDAQREARTPASYVRT